MSDWVLIADICQPAAGPGCQCGKGDNPCLASIKQEDLLCNTCRAGCEVQDRYGHWQKIGQAKARARFPFGMKP